MWANIISNKYVYNVGLIPEIDTNSTTTSNGLNWEAMWKKIIA